VLALKIVSGDLTCFSTNRDCPFLEFAGVTVVEQTRSIERLASRVDAESPRYIHRLYAPMLPRQESQNFRNHEDTLPLATPTGITRVCWVARCCGFAPPDYQLPLSHPLPVFLSISLSILLEFARWSPVPSIISASVWIAMRNNSTSAFPTRARISRNIRVIIGCYRLLSANQ